MQGKEDIACIQDAPLINAFNAWPGQEIYFVVYISSQ